MVGMTGWAIITDYELFRLVTTLYKSDRKLYLRRDYPTLDDFRRLRRQLRGLNVIVSDRDYTGAAYRILANSDRPAEDICCTADPFCYISHLSAMQRYGLTERRSKSLMLTAPAPRIAKKLLLEKMRHDHGDDVQNRLDEIVPLHLVWHPKRVRGRPVKEHKTIHMGEWVKDRTSAARVATAGQTFLDMVQEPRLCGGMAHVIESWKQNAPDFVNEIIASVQNAHTSIAKVRAGYILSEVMGFSDPQIEAWKKFAMRGGSRVLDPSKPYAPTFSEEWMISINV